MKTNIIILFLLTTTAMHASIEVVSNSSDAELHKQLINLVANDLGLAGIQIEIDVIDERKFIGGQEHKASVKKTGDSSYTIFLHPKLQRVEVIRYVIHEMAHVWQMEEERLAFIGSHAVWFEGTIYTAQEEYHQRLYEREATRIERELFRKYRRL